MCPGGRFQAQVRVDPVAALPQQRLPRPVHRGHAVLEDVLVAAAEHRLVTVRGVPEVEIGFGIR